LLLTLLKKDMEESNIIMKKKKLFCVIFSIFLFALILISCGKDSDTISEETLNTSDNGDNENAETNQEQKPELDLPDVKYDGYEFRVLNTPSSEMRADTTIYAEEETGDGVNDAVYKRNRLVEARFDIEIKEIVVGRGAISQRATTSIRSGADDYDLIMYSIDEGAGIAQNNMAVDYNEIPYVNLTQSWWDSDMMRDLVIGGHNYFVTGAFSLAHYGKTQGIFFNKQLLQDLALDSPYGIVNAGKWTFDKFHEMAKGASKDLDGDGVFTDKDQYGFMAWPWIYGNAFIAGAGQQMVSKDENDMHVFNLNNEKFIQVFQKLMGIMHDENMLYDQGGGGDFDYAPMFVNDQSLFFSSNMHSAVSFRGMETDFGIIPLPKYDENQNGYHTYVFPPPVMLVPTTSFDLNRTGMILEALCYESTDTVVKAYYDDLLKTKISRDDDSEAMLDIIFRNRIYSVTDIYYMPETFEQFYELCRNKDANIVSWLEKNENRIAAAVEKNNQAFSDN